MFVIKLDCKENTVSIFHHSYLQTYFYENIVNIDIQVIVIIEVKNYLKTPTFYHKI